jgi:hypothetical protein
MKSFFTRATALLFLSLAAVSGGCGSSNGPPAHKDAGEGHDRPDMKVAPHPDGGGRDGDAGSGSTCGMNGPTQGLGAVCACDAECGSGHCADGLCCDRACANGCETCSAPDAGGTCIRRSFGASPRRPADCVADTASTCGLDGTCDGAGACHFYLGNTCVGGTCSGDSVVGAYACDGNGACKPGITQMLCVPYTCDPSSGTCFEACTTAQGQCDSQHSCDLTTGSCGKARPGAHCNDDSGCLSGYCADHVCCNIACQGACVACNLPGRLGACLPIDPGKPDPRGVCKDQGSASCGHNGTCDGVGGCATYARDTQCLQPSCTGNRLNTAGTCDGLGTCRAPGVQDCHPFRCVDGACTKSCETVNDCDQGTACTNNTCGPKPLGAVCASASECSTNFCVDGVCCASACSGTCQYCALPTSPGFCMTVAAHNPDPRGVCQDKGATSCATNGKCDGTGSCETYVKGTVCAGEACAGGLYTAASTCNTTGQCVAPDSTPCAPYICNGSQCFNVCATNDQCKPPNSCSPTNSCGPKPPGAVCLSTAECQSGLFCAQGYCCNSPCSGACQSCALPSSLGVCTNVPASQVDPTGQCTDKGATSCGTNGKCDGNAGCALYLSGTTCIGSSCPSGTSTFTGTSACNGAGKCVTPNNAPCFPYQCGVNVCKNSCTSDGDCQSPAVCSSNGSCGLKGIGQACVTAAECGSGFCSQQVCCQTACTGVCQSCSLAGSPGSCTNVPSGTADPQATCHDQGNTSCGTDGFCDGNGACREYAGGTSCAPPSCPAGSSTLTSGRTCNGTGTCQAATTIGCAPYLCNGSTACKAACAVDADCRPPDICDPKTSLCGTQKRLGQSCAQTSDCLTGDSCVDGVCCSASSCTTCQACNIAGSAGNCANVPSNALEPHGLCATNPPCGFTGSCNGNGKCQNAGTGVSCGSASCPTGSSTFTPVSHCTGAGACAAPVSSTCTGGFNCNSSTASCKTTCTGDGDCVAPLTCQGSGSTQTCAKKPNGQACPGGATQCISGFCTDGVCCGTGPCGTCQACNVNGLGSCAPLAAGTTAPSGQCAASGTCGNTGTCNGSSACTKAATSVTCLAASCSTSGATYTPTSFCSGGGSCSTPGAVSCSPYFCGTSGCKITCNNIDSDCISGDYCTGAAGACLPVKSLGVACLSNHECGSANCVDGVCCGSPSCGTCLSCNVTGKAGTCTIVGANVAEPHGRCSANGTCGNTGLCTGAGLCQQQPTSVSCASATCSGSTFTPTSFCSGGSPMGSCAAPAKQSCSPYLCSGSTCASSCSLDTDCLRVTGNMNYCTGTNGSCLPVKSNGVACIGSHECGSGNCLDGVCCGSSACGTCQACNVAGSLGSCANVAVNVSEPHNKCPANGTCGNTGLCNGSGSCLQQPTTVSCAGASCSGSTFTPTSFCSSTVPTGSCTTPATQSCSPYLCSGSSCASSCNLDTDCVNVSGNKNYCTATNGSCLPVKALGVACIAAHECGSGNCVDGVCCGSPSCVTCLACNLMGSLGTCANVAVNVTDPHSRCGANGTCGNTGACTGGGACKQQPATVMCSGPSCTGSTSTLASFCSGSGGSCPTAATASCGAYLCGATSCKTSCTLDSACINGDYCTSPVNGNCAPKNTLGKSCGGNNQCSSGFCIDSVCCQTNGCATCQSCALNGSGTCAAIAAGQTAPAGQCTVGATCGDTGLCNGSSGCQQRAANTSCGSVSCPASSPLFTAAPKCDGNGSCITPSATNCGLYVCTLAGCPGTCTVDTDCVAGSYCAGGTCAQQGLAGVACTGNDQCKSGFCTNGFCCGSSLCPSCQSCGVSGLEGACTNLPAGSADPIGTCTAQISAATTCLLDGLCDGGGGCQNWPSTTLCATSCSFDQSQFLRSFCTGDGACDMTPADQQVISCPTMACDGTLGCQ